MTPERSNELAIRYNHSSPNGFGGAFGFQILEQLKPDGTLQENSEQISDDDLRAFFLKMGDASPAELRDWAFYSAGVNDEHRRRSRESRQSST